MSKTIATIILDIEYNDNENLSNSNRSVPYGLRNNQEITNITIERLYVDDNYRNKGIGTAIVNGLINNKYLSPNTVIVGDVINPIATKFWSKWDKDIPTDYTISELEDWCYFYGNFRVR